MTDFFQQALGDVQGLEESLLGPDLLNVVFALFLDLLAKIEPSDINTSPANLGFRIDPLTIILEETLISVKGDLIRAFSIERDNGSLSLN